MFEVLDLRTFTRCASRIRMLKPLRLLLPLFFVCAATAQGQAPVAVDVRAEIAKKLPGTKAEDVRATPIDGVYEVTRGGDIAYVSKDGKYAIAGELFDLTNNDNLTETRRRDLRLALLNSVPESQMLVFSPRDTKYTITVFTDVDCGYCRKLHSQMAEYNKLGVRVRYLFFPRSGPNTESWATAESVWCSPNRNDALTRAKREEKIKTAKCASTPVARHFQLGEEMGVRGTPAIVLSSGEMLPGYVPPAMLVEHLRTASR